MIINDIRYGKAFLGMLGPTQLTVETDEGRGKITTANIHETTLTTLNKNIKNFRVETIEDLQKLHTTLTPIIPSESYHDFERALLNATQKPWKIFGKETISHIPRPLSVIAQTTTGIEFLLFAPDAANIVHAILAYEAIYDHLKATLPNAQEKEGLLILNQSPAHALALIEKAIHATAQKYGIAVKKGINLCGTGTREDVKKLIEDHHLIYLENPYPLDHETSYQELTNLYQEQCFIITSSAEFYHTQKTNALLLSYQHALHAKKEFDSFPPEQKNIFLTGVTGIIPIASSLTIPAIKFTLKNTLGKNLIKAFIQTYHAIRTHKLAL